jgi:hypothetical protein
MGFSVKESPACLRDHGHHIETGDRTDRAAHAGEKTILKGHEEFGDNAIFLMYFTRKMEAFFEEVA